MAFRDALFDAYTLEGNFPGVYHRKGAFFYDTSTEDSSHGRGRPAGGGGRRLQFVGSPSPSCPPFIKLDISDLPALLVRSPSAVYGVAIQLVKNLLHLPAFGSSAGVGRRQFPAGRGVRVYCGYRLQEAQEPGRGAVGAPWPGAAAMAVISIPINYFIVYPAYVVLYGLPLEAIVGMYQEILGTVAQVPTSNALLNCLMVFNVPFTLCKGLLDVALCFLIYKPLSPLLHK